MQFTAEILVFHAHKFQTLKISKHPQNLHTQKYSIKAILLPKKTLKLLYTAEEEKLNTFFFILIGPPFHISKKIVFWLKTLCHEIFDP